MQKIFESLGLAESEVSVYMTLLEFGPNTPTKLAKRLSVPRSTLYGILDNLTRQGLVVVSEKDHAKIWCAERPERILELFEEMQLHLEKQKQLFSKQLPILNALSNSSFTYPRFYFYEGAAGVQQILKDILLYRNIETLAFWPIQDMLEIVGSDFMYQHNVQRIRQNISIRALWPEGKKVDAAKFPFLGAGKEFKREIRIAPASIDCSMSYWIYGNRIGFISSQVECFGFIIESSEMKQLLKTQFDYFWKISQSIQMKNAKTAKFILENRLG